MSGEPGAEGGAEGSGLLLNQPVVIDNGCSAIKAGFAGGSKPKVRFLGALLFVRIYATSLGDDEVETVICRYR